MRMCKCCGRDHIDCRCGPKADFSAPELPKESRAKQRSTPDKPLTPHACDYCGCFHDPAYSDCATGEPEPQPPDKPRPLQDRMAEALQGMINFAVTPNDAIGMSIRGNALVLLAEYRQRQPEISQETAQELLRVCRQFSAGMNDEHDSYPLVKASEIRQTRNAIQDAEAELRGKTTGDIQP